MELSEVLSENQIKWIVASFAYNAKVKIDSISYIVQNSSKIPKQVIRTYLRAQYLSFYVECAAVVDNYLKLTYGDPYTLPKSKKRIYYDARDALRTKYSFLESKLYFQRDKFAAHHDLNDIMRSNDRAEWSSWYKEIDDMKHELADIMHICKNKLPTSFRIEYVEHDPACFRIVHHLDYRKEEACMYIKHPYRKRFEHFMNMLPSDSKTSMPQANSVADAVRFYLARNVLSQPACVTMECGICGEETLQKLQFSCILLNILWDEHMWATKSVTFNDPFLRYLDHSVIAEVDAMSEKRLSQIVD